MSKNEERADESTLRSPLRLWPGIVAAILVLVVRFVVPVVVPDALPVVLFGGLLLGLLVIVWWAFFSRAPRVERWSAVALVILALLVVRPFLHRSIREAGMGLLFPILALPLLGLTFVAWAWISHWFSPRTRRVTMALTILLTVGFWTLMRTGGLTHEGESELAWRWTKTPEERLLAQAQDEETVLPPADAFTATDADWPGFRGPDREGIVRGVRIETDWSASPPVELWRRPVGPGWSSFAVRGNVFYTQEQRGEVEVVSCYHVTTGQPFWKHRDVVRFWESNAGPGPRGTPTLHGDRLFAFGATGVLSALDARDGKVVWTRDAASETETDIPYWGFSSSPQVVDDMVMVAVAGSLVAYDAATGDLRWSRPGEGDGYSSPHLTQIDGIAQVLLQNAAGTISVTPADGTVLWKHPWKGLPIVQPARTADGDVLISADDSSGIRRLTVARDSDTWTVEERWTSKRVKPYFNDSAVHKGHVYGFTGRALACMDVETGEGEWQGGRYGRGQLLLLADQDLLLVLTDKGSVALVEAVPDHHAELARFFAIQGKTWNHPVLVGDILLVRNAQEMAAFRLALVDR